MAAGPAQEVNLHIIQSSREVVHMIPKKIVFCADFSENSARAGRYAAAYAKVFGSEVTVLHVIDSWAGFPSYAESVHLNVLEVTRALETSAKAQLEDLAAAMSKDVSKVATRCIMGVPAEEIVKTAEQESADLIIMGTHGWSGFRHLLLGSVAEKTLRTASCPVLVVKSSPAGEAT
jgi:universal stress protein A